MVSKPIRNIFSSTTVTPNSTINGASTPPEVIPSLLSRVYFPLGSSGIANGPDAGDNRLEYVGFSSTDGVENWVTPNPNADAAFFGQTFQDSGGSLGLPQLGSAILPQFQAIRFNVLDSSQGVLNTNFWPYFQYARAVTLQFTFRKRQHDSDAECFFMQSFSDLDADSLLKVQKNVDETIGVTVRSDDGRPPVTLNSTATMDELAFHTMTVAVDWETQFGADSGRVRVDLNGVTIIDEEGIWANSTGGRSSNIIITQAQNNGPLYNTLFSTVEQNERASVAASSFSLHDGFQEGSDWEAALDVLHFAEKWDAYTTRFFGDSNTAGEVFGRVENRGEGDADNTASGAYAFLAGDKRRVHNVVGSAMNRQGVDRLINNGSNGSQANQWEALSFGNVNTWGPGQGYLPAFFVMMGGNDIRNGATGAQAYQSTKNFVNYIRDNFAAANDGKEPLIVVSTILPHNVPAEQTEATAYNNLMRAATIDPQGSDLKADAFVDLATVSDPDNGGIFPFRDDVSATQDAMYFSADQVHINVLGTRLMGEAWAAAMAPLRVKDYR